MSSMIAARRCEGPSWLFLFELEHMLLLCTAYACPLKVRLIVISVKLCIFPPREQSFAFASWVTEESVEKFAAGWSSAE